VATTLNLCEQPPWVLASREFNDDPQPIMLQGASQADRRLFDHLDATNDAEARARIFDEYMSVKFYLHQWNHESSRAQRSIKNSYVRYLRGWGFDSNSVEGAVLKGWVESRIGIAPCYHKQPIRPATEDDYTPYQIDCMRGHARTNSINEQLDLVYAYTQYELRRVDPHRRWLALYRGINDALEHAISERIDRLNYYVRLNNLSSFTSDPERAWEFGSTVWAVDVPVCKVFFYGELLPQSTLRGENEYLVIGGEYRVKELLF
jgi:NAD+--dinitrogen-reductase ADP-D-ribosyltransferase